MTRMFPCADPPPNYGYQQPGFQQPGFQQPASNPSYPQSAAGGYPAQGGGYPTQAGGGFPTQGGGGGGGYPTQGGYPQGGYAAPAGGYPPQYPNYPNAAPYSSPAPNCESSTKIIFAPCLCTFSSIFVFECHEKCRM